MRTDCLARHHAECWREHKQCSGCASKRFLQPGDPVPTVPLPGSREAGRVVGLLARVVGQRSTIVVSLAGVAAVLGLATQPSGANRLLALALICVVGIFVGWRSRRWPVPVVLTTVMALVSAIVSSVTQASADQTILGINLLWALANGVGLGLPGVVAAGLSRSAAHQLGEKAPPLVEPPEEQSKGPCKREKA